MNKKTTLFFLIIICISVNKLWAQFNTVEIKTIPMRIEVVAASADILNDSLDGNGQRIAEEIKSGSRGGIEPVKPKKLLFSTPLNNLVISSYYGYRDDPFTHKRKFHAGVDYVSSSENVYAMMPGRIKDIGYNKALGNYIVLIHGDFIVTYGHLFAVVGNTGDFVEAGQSVGLSGSTGRSTGDHLHLAIKHKGKVVDPFPIVNYIELYIKKVRTELTDVLLVD